ncbi:MAG: N-acetylneuraminate synthase [Nitrospinota bacterium]
MSSKSIYVIAEAGVNHNGNLKRAIEMVDAAAEAKVDAIKFQTFKAEKLALSQAPKADYQINQTGSSESQLEMLRKLELDKNSHFKIQDRCNLKGIQFLSTPFDQNSLNFLIQSLKVPKLKIPSGEITNAPLLLKAAASGKPLIVSTGMCDMEEVKIALGVLAFGFTKSGNKPNIESFKNAFESPEGKYALRNSITLLHCTSAYPAPFEDVNLKTMETMASVFGLPVGYSDHTSGISVSIAAVACGAVVIEKHFTMDKTLPGPDHQASLDPEELKALVKAIREVEKALGVSNKFATPSEIENREIARKSLVTTQNIKMGELFTENNIDIKRPGNGISPLQYWDWIGKKAERDFKANELIIP